MNRVQELGSMKTSGEEEREGEEQGGCWRLSGSPGVKVISRLLGN